MPSSQREMVHEQHPVMSADLFSAAIKGNKDLLLQCLGLLKEQEEVEVTIEAAYPTCQQIEVDQHAVQYLLGSATHFGDTLLHLLVTEMHNDLALKVFQRDRSLMKARNKKSETALHCAAKVGNVQVIQALIQLAPNVVKDAVRETDNNEDTALHVAAKHGHRDVARELMKMDPGVAYVFNKEEFSPLYIATVGGYTSMVKTMLEDDPSLACQQCSNGMYPIHVAARVGDIELVKHFMEKYLDDAKLLDHCRQNLFHIVAEENKVEVLKGVGDEAWELQNKMDERLINARNYEGNTPLHIAAIKGHTSVMRVIWDILTPEENEVRNNQGLTPFLLSMNQIEKNASKSCNRHKINGRELVIGLSSVLITTVKFGAAFAIPRGYNQDNGTPILGRKYMFKAFILANTISCIYKPIYACFECCS